MNLGTRIRTLLVVATCLNTALLATDITQFQSPTLDMIYKVVSVVLNFIIVACATYYNNDYTDTACRSTGYMRWLKSIEKGEGVGDGLEDEPETEAEEDVLEGDFDE